MIVVLGKWHVLLANLALTRSLKVMEHVTTAQMDIRVVVLPVNMNTDKVWNVISFTYLRFLNILNFLNHINLIYLYFIFIPLFSCILIEL